MGWRRNISGQSTLLARRGWQPLHPRFSLKGLIEVSADAASAGFGKKLTGNMFYLRLLHSGWELIDKEGPPWKWKKASPRGKDALLMDRSCMQPSYFLIQGSNSAVHPFEEEWADWDQSGRIIVSQEGRILAGKGIRRKTLHFEELADSMATARRTSRLRNGPSDGSAGQLPATSLRVSE
jgi:hypothetical protein